MKQYKEVTVCAYIVFVNGIAFFVTVSRNVRYRTVEPIKDMKQPTIIKAVKNVRDIYTQGAFKVTWMLMDRQFKPMQVNVVNLGICLNEVAKDEHVGEIK